MQGSIKVGRTSVRLGGEAKRQVFFRCTWLVHALMITLMLLSQPLLAKEVGFADYVRGIATIKNGVGKISVLAKGESVSEGDELYTSDNSFAIISFIDQTKVTLRPNTTFKVTEFNYEPEEPEENSGFFSLLRGGFRMVTGLLNKKKPNAMLIKSLTATIGIRGTEFDARLCEGDCAKNKKVSKKELRKKGIKKKAVGRIAFIRGTLTAENTLFSKTRTVTTGGPIYENDLLKTSFSSFAVIAFRDKSRVTLRANSELFIEQYRYKPEKPKANVFIMQMVKGGMRMLTGLVAKLNRNQTRVHTMTATIGVRGTGFDLFCSGDCGESLEEKTTQLSPLYRLFNSLIRPAYAQQPDNGLFVHVWSGSIVMEQDSVKTELQTGKSAYIKDKLTLPRIIKQLPKQMEGFDAPRPDAVEVDHEKLFGVDAETTRDLPQGLYVTVYDGHVAVENNQGHVTNIGAGEALVALTSGEVLRLPELPEFQVNDWVPSPKNINLQKLEAKEIFNSPGDDEQQSLECTIS